MMISCEARCSASVRSPPKYVTLLVIDWLIFDKSIVRVHSLLLAGLDRQRTAKGCLLAQGNSNRIWSG